MYKLVMTCDLIWTVLMVIGLSVGIFTGTVSAGEFYIGMALTIFTGKHILLIDRELLEEEDI